MELSGGAVAEAAIRFRPLTPDDFPLLLDWLQRPHVKEWWDDGDDTLDKVAAHYSDAPDMVERFIVRLDDRDAGYFQYCRLGEGHVGADMFLADGSGLSKGTGTRCLKAFVELIVDAEAPRIISVDPHPDNARGIRAYEKCGFVHDPARSDAGVHFMVRPA